MGRIVLLGTTCDFFFFFFFFYTHFKKTFQKHFKNISKTFQKHFKNISITFLNTFLNTFQSLFKHLSLHFSWNATLINKITHKSQFHEALTFPCNDVTFSSVLIVTKPNRWDSKVWQVMLLYLRSRWLLMVIFKRFCITLYIHSNQLLTSITTDIEEILRCL